MHFTYRGCTVRLIAAHFILSGLNQSVLTLPGYRQDAIRFIDDQLEVALGGHFSRYA